MTAFRRLDEGKVLDEISKYCTAGTLAGMFICHFQYCMCGALCGLIEYSVISYILQRRGKTKQTTHRDAR